MYAYEWHEKFLEGLQETVSNVCLWGGFWARNRHLFFTAQVYCSVLFKFFTLCMNLFSIKFLETSMQDGDVGRHGSPLHTTTSKLLLRNIRNRMEWKSDNYRIEETTSIQTGRRHADAEQAGPTPVDILGARSPRPMPGPPAQDSSARKISRHNFWLWKPVGIE